MKRSHIHTHARTHARKRARRANRFVGGDRAAIIRDLGSDRLEVSRAPRCKSRGSQGWDSRPFTKGAFTKGEAHDRGLTCSRPIVEGREQLSTANFSMTIHEKVIF